MTQTPAIILCRPQMGENIGAAARAMLNFGLTDMRLISPRDGWPNPRAVAMASGAASQVLDHARISDDLATGLGDLDFVFATTARGRELTKPVYTPAEAMAEARAMISEGRRVGIMFGAERAGLENEEVARAQAIITVPVNPDFPSLNLGQAVLLLGYEFGRDTLPRLTHSARHEADAEPATAIEVERLGDAWQASLDRAGFFFPEDKAPSMQLTLRNMWSRLRLTRAEVRIFHGMLRHLSRRQKPPAD